MLGLLTVSSKKKPSAKRALTKTCCMNRASLVYIHPKRGRGSESAGHLLDFCQLIFFEVEHVDSGGERV